MDYLIKGYYGRRPISVCGKFVSLQVHGIVLSEWQNNYYLFDIKDNDVCHRFYKWINPYSYWAWEALTSCVLNNLPAISDLFSQYGDPTYSFEILRWFNFFFILSAYILLSFVLVTKQATTLVQMDDNDDCGLKWTADDNILSCC